MRQLGGIGAVLTLVLFAGCGSGSHPAATSGSTSATQSSAQSSGRSPATTKDAFIGRADSICATARARAAPLEAQAKRDEKLPDTQATLNALAALVDENGAVIRPLAAQMSALVPPAQDRATFSRYLAAINERLSILGQLSAALRRGDAATIRSLKIRNTAVKAREQEIATAYGFRVCGHSG